LGAKAQAEAIRAKRVTKMAFMVMSIRGQTNGFLLWQMRPDLNCCDAARIARGCR
jgi:hypothetical protein